METLVSMVFMIFSFGFFLFACYIIVHDNRQSVDRRDRRRDQMYQQMLAERREFGYTEHEQHIQPPKKPFWSK